MANGSIVVSKIAWVANRVFENLLKLWMGAIKTFIEWSINDTIHKDCLSKPKAFYDLPENAADYLSWKLATSVKLMTLIQKMQWAMLEKLGFVKDDNAHHIGALNPDDNA